MMHTILDIFKKLIKWAAFVLVIVVLLKIISFIFPWFTQNNIKDKINSNATSTSKAFKLPAPGSWSLLSTSTKKIEPLQAPTVPDGYYNNSGYQVPIIPSDNQ
jgi:uncharacterized membrane protein YjfL (UPF0719 family)